MCVEGIDLLEEPQKEGHVASGVLVVRRCCSGAGETQTEMRQNVYSKTRCINERGCRGNPCVLWVLTPWKTCRKGAVLPGMF